MKKYALATVYLTVFLDILSFGIIIPLLPFYAQKFGANATTIGLLMSCNAVAQFLFNPIWGRFSDKYGRRPVMLLTVLGSAIAYGMFGFANSIFMLFVSRTLAGIAGATIGVAQSYISDLTTKENRSKVLGQLGAAFALGFVFGPALSGFLANEKFYLSTVKYGIDLSFFAPYSYSIPGYLSGSLSLINFVMVYFFLQESNKTVKEAKENNKPVQRKTFDWQGFTQVMKDNDMLMLISIQFISMVSLSNLFSTFALFLQKRFDFGIGESSLMFAYFGLCSALIQGALVGKLVKRFSEVKLLVFSTLFLTVGMFIISYMPNIYLILVASTLIFFGNGIINPCLTSLISQKAKEEQTGVTLGVSQSIGSLARIFGPLWGGFIFQFAGYHYPYLTGGIFALVSFIMSLRFFEHYEKSENIQVTTSV